ncbi:RNA polymerase I-associated factor PAF67-domain-containing protein [Radiomyces spectabilis]|uniref:RNA polymerase I-associated factor PAF67-domain-containing protein n=1 Tax=Radiomyces spectabilis TaxID=64574 RepID=UPI00221F2086|nr:RNA polymerase I-associated factor PAF67-domain-containing protein [Radiomyces spectabilis]KAI8377870.1 RNA polymerase I-associated factor PAF67-domain-containing protein [Radiomyces spectabilis]
MYQDTFEEDDLLAEVEFVTQVHYSQTTDLDDGFEAEVVPPQQPNTAHIPDSVKNFILHFYRNVTDNNVFELHNVYDSSFNKLSDRYYQKQPWPEAELIAPLVNGDTVFLTLYRELYYRHIYARLTPTLEHRIRSYENYCDLFNYILNSDGPVNLELPNPWLWDIIDEFIYQFQSFSNYRDRLKNKSEQEIEMLRGNNQIWSSYSVLNVLYSFVQKSRINEQLLVSKNGGDMMEAAGEYGSRPLYKMLGYFSIVGLLRVHCLLGDYVLALKMMDNIVLNKKAMFARVTACHVTTYYYVGFAYMMMRRYADAIKAFSTILSFIQRTKQYHSRSYQYDQITRKGDQMYALLAICIAMSPTRLDENIHSQLREKHGEQLFKMQKGEDNLAIFEELFQYACPKFISAVGINPNNANGVDPHQNMIKIFMNDIQTQINLPTLRSFMKLYTTMGIDKLAKFLEMDADELKMQLLVFKQKSRQYKWVEGELLDGVYMPTSDLDFCLKQDVVHIAESKVGRRYADWFLRNINRCEDIVASLENKA